MLRNLEVQDSKIRTVLSMMIAPGIALKKVVQGVPIYFSLLISGVSIGLFFLQTALDLYKTGQQPLSFAIKATLIGVLFGLIGVPIVSAIVWVIAKPFGCKRDIKWTISAFCLSYSGALVYCLLGIVFSQFFQWRTAVAFGVTGALWAIGPMVATIREMVGGKIIFCVLLATVAGSILLYSWSLIGNI